MGMPMAQVLRGAGHELFVLDLDPGRVREFTADGGQAVESVAELAGQVEALMLSLPEPADCEAVLLGSGGAIETAPPGQLCFDFSTNGPATARRIAAAAAERGMGYLDAPVSGGPWGAAAGTLTIMVGGAEEDFERARALFDVVGGNVQWFGPPGSGCLAKLANQIILGAINVAVAEAYVLAARGGLDPQRVFEMLRTATAGGVTHDRLLEDVILPRKFTPRFSVDLLQKDLGLAADVGRQLGVRLLLTSLTDQLFQEAQGQGLGGEDMGAVLKPLERLAGVVVGGAEPAA
jgi:3-hydroxyisobutyrate dehydrogenase/2-hydroxy-3-oxopropionate reductase